MAVPENVLTGRSRGGHALIRDGAKVVETADDILEEIRPQVESGPWERQMARDDDDLLLVHMDRGETYDLDELSGLARSGLSSRVLELELMGRVVRP